MEEWIAQPSLKVLTRERPGEGLVEGGVPLAKGMDALDQLVQPPRMLTVPPTLALKPARRSVAVADEALAWLTGRRTGQREHVSGSRRG